MPRDHEELTILIGSSAIARRYGLACFRSDSTSVNDEGGGFGSFLVLGVCCLLDELFECGAGPMASAAAEAGVGSAVENCG